MSSIQPRTRTRLPGETGPLVEGAATRIHYFDWLRAIAVLGVVLYHALLPFGRGLWFIRNAQLSNVLGAVVSVLSTFGLPILFLVAGASARFALQRRSTRAFLAERARRLLVPFVIGTVLLTPPAGYLMGLHSGTVSGSFLQYLVAYPGVVFDYQRTVGLSPRNLEVGMHLWFLPALFVFAALGSPIFAFLSSDRGRSVVDALAGLARRPGAMLLIAIPTTLPILALYAFGSPGVWDSWAYGWFGVVFLVGYVMYTDDRLVAAARRDLVPALVVGVLMTTALVAADFAGWASAPHTFSASYVLMLSLYGITGWAWTLALLGVGMHLAFMQRPLNPRVGEAVLPMYVLHFPIVIAITFAVVQLPLDLWAKLGMNIGLGVAASLLVTAVAIRVPFLRLLLGVRRARPSVVAPAPSPPAPRRYARPGSSARS
jgi:glucans biosynthesis protein C